MEHKLFLPSIPIKDKEEGLSQIIQSIYSEKHIWNHTKTNMVLSCNNISYFSSDLYHKPLSAILSV